MMEDEIGGMDDAGEELDGAAAAGPASESAGPPGGSDALSKLTMAERKIIYGKATSDKIVQLLHSVKGKPDAALAVGALFVLKAMSSEIRGKVPPDAVKQFRDVLLGDLAELADASGIDVGPEHVDGAKKIMDQTVRAAHQQMAQGGGGPSQGVGAPAVPAGGPAPGGLIGGAMAPAAPMGRMAA